MESLNSKQILSNLYGLMMEINYHRPDNEVLAEIHGLSEDHINKHLLKIRQLRIKLQAQENKNRFNRAIEQLNLLKAKGLEELKKIITPEEQMQLLPLFRKFEEITKSDEQSITEDNELLYFIEFLKNKMDEDSK